MLPVNNVFEMNKYVKKKCLKCDRDFPSLGNHNRLCAHCSIINANLLFYDKKSDLTAGVNNGKKPNAE